MGEDVSLPTLRREAQPVSAGAAGITESEDGGMKLSEAIRLGAMQLAPAKNLSVITLDDNGEPCAACALGAAAFAVGIRHQIMNATTGEPCAFLERWPWVATVTEPPPHMAWHCGTANVAYFISALYESCDMTREAIADWVATIEPSDDDAAQEQPAQPVEVTA
jgi:hypothetical protein